MDGQEIGDLPERVAAVADDHLIGAAAGVEGNGGSCGDRLDIELVAALAAVNCEAVNAAEIDGGRVRGKGQLRKGRGAGTVHADAGDIVLGDRVGGAQGVAVVAVIEEQLVGGGTAKDLQGGVVRHTLDVETVATLAAVDHKPADVGKLDVG